MKFKPGDRVRHKTVQHTGIGVIQREDVEYMDKRYLIHWENGWFTTDPEKSLIGIDDPNDILKKLL